MAERIRQRRAISDITADFSIDGAIGDSLISYINHSDEEQDLNAEFFINEGSEHPRVWARTTKPVQVLTEIFLSYGSVHSSGQVLQELMNYIAGRVRDGISALGDHCRRTDV